MERVADPARLNALARAERLRRARSLRAAGRDRRLSCAGHGSGTTPIGLGSRRSMTNSPRRCRRRSSTESRGRVRHGIQTGPGLGDCRCAHRASGAEWLPLSAGRARRSAVQAEAVRRSARGVREGRGPDQERVTEGPAASTRIAMWISRASLTAWSWRRNRRRRAAYNRRHERLAIAALAVSIAGAPSLAQEHHQQSLRCDRRAARSEDARVSAFPASRSASSTTACRPCAVSASPTSRTRCRSPRTRFPDRVDLEDVCRDGDDAARRTGQGRSRAPVRTYLPDFRVRDEAVSRDVTVWHLLTHSAAGKARSPGPIAARTRCENFVVDARCRT